MYVYIIEVCRFACKHVCIFTYEKMRNLTAFLFESRTEAKREQPHALPRGRPFKCHRTSSRRQKERPLSFLGSSSTITLQRRPRAQTPCHGTVHKYDGLGDHPSFAGRTSLVVRPLFGERRWRATDYLCG